MTFIITLIALVVERFLYWGHLRQWRWFHHYQRVLGQYVSKSPSWIILLVYLLPLVILVGLINALLNGWLYSVPKLIFGVFVLLYCMGPENLWAQALSCINEIHKEDPQLAVDRAMSSFGITQPSNSQALHRTLISAIFVAANKRVFAVVFWFVVLGPVGAVLYRTIALCAEQSEFGLTAMANDAQKLLDWIPARLFTFIFALGGHFVEVFKIWKKEVNSTVSMNDKIIADCGIAALDTQTQRELPEDGTAEKAALDLLDRVFIMGLVILAMIVIVI